MTQPTTKRLATEAMVSNGFAPLVPAWTTGKSYKAGQVVLNPWGWQVQAQADHTSASVYSTDVMTDKWLAVSPPTAYEGNRFTALGDSITANYGASNDGNVADGYAAHASFNSGQRMRFMQPTLATGGFTTQQIRDTHLPQLFARQAAGPRLHAAMVLAGTNNVGGGGATAYNFAVDSVALQTVYARMLAMSIKPIACTIPPRTDNANVQGYVDQWNTWVRTLASRFALDVVDFHDVLTDRTTGGYKSGGLNADAIHPSYAGLKLMGLEAAKLATRFPAHQPYMVQHKLDASDLLSGAGLFLTDSDSNGAADGISIVGTGSGIVYSIVTDADGVTKWQRMTLSGTGAGALLQAVVTLPTSGVGIADWKTLEVGDVLEITGRVQTSGFDAIATPTTNLSWNVGVTFNGASGTIPGATSIHVDVADGRFYGRAIVPAGMNGTMKANMSLNNGPVSSGTVWAQFTQLGVRNLTALGLA